MSYPLLDFMLASLLMGLGIGADVAGATFARANQLRTLRLAFIWIVGVSLTHTLFPMLGYLMTYFSIQLLPELTPVVGVIAFSCIFWYLKGEFSGFSQVSNQAESRQLLVTFGLILAVSWDALWSGPAKSAQVIGWPELLVWLSFVLVGVFVSMLAILSLKCGLKFQSRHSTNGPLVWLGNWMQFSIVGYFGLLALLQYTLGINLAWWQVMLMSSGLVGIALLRCIPVSQQSSAST